MSDSKIITKEELRVAIGNALLKLNDDILKDVSDKDKLVMNKIALRLIRNLLFELGISEWKDSIDVKR